MERISLYDISDRREFIGSGKEGYIGLQCHIKSLRDGKWYRSFTVGTLCPWKLNKQVGMEILLVQVYC